MDRQPHTFLPDNIEPYERVPPSNWERLFDGLDRQLNGVLRYACGTGVVSGGLVQADKTVSVGTFVVGGGGKGTWIGQTDSDTDISSLLANSVTNVVWACLISVPTTGPDSWPGYADTFASGTVLFKVQASAPANSIKLGTITLDGSGVVTSVDNTVLDRPEIIPAASWKTWTGYVDVTSVPANTTTWVEVDHSGEIEFSLFGEITFWNPKQTGFKVRKIESCQSGQFGFELVHSNDAGEPYYADTSVRIYWTRMGVPK